MPEARGWLTADEFFAAELARHERAWLAGDYRSMVEAFLLCGWNARPQPAWVVEAVCDQLMAGYFGKPKVERGRKGNPAAAERARDVHRIRWNAAETWYGMRSLLPHFPLPSGEDPYSATWKGVYRFVSHELGRTKSPARGSAERIEESHQVVRRAVRNGNGAQFGVLD